MNELVSFVIANYNKSNYLEASLSSVCNQTYGNLEIIIVDDGSTDSSPEIIKKLAARDPRIRYFLLPHGGKIKAYNYGVSQALGDFIKIWSSDDILLEKATEILLANISDNDIVAHNCSIADEQLRILRDKFIDLTPFTRSEITVKEVIRGLTYPSGCYLMKKKCLGKIFPLPEEASYEDRYIFMMIINQNYRVKYLDRSLAVYRQTAGSAFGGVYNFNKKVFFYRVERDLKMMRLFQKVLSPGYRHETSRRLEELQLLHSGNAESIWLSNFKFTKKLHIYFIKYFYGIYKCTLFLKKRVFLKNQTPLRKEI